MSTLRWCVAIMAATPQKVPRWTRSLPQRAREMRAARQGCGAERAVVSGLLTGLSFRTSRQRAHRSDDCPRSRDAEDAALALGLSDGGRRRSADDVLVDGGAGQIEP